ncbi:alpha/beta hydrolase [Micromonospora phytophila]|uniref:alpha/beta fold hydrolase n=1 Tax=Micromonospora phytophila TaxID=709888 RepID=UPI002030C27B|nr:alpha/beta fold hydrolase [Micromonospora phytophila]MCM0673374.1 alpha/beta hydrolase [Micromonospora phytophila]
MSKAKRRLRGAAFTIVAVTALTAAFSQPLFAAKPSPMATVSGASLAAACDKAPTGVQVSDHWLPFTVPAGLMPDPQFDGLSAELQVHRVQPVYAHGKCPAVPNRAAVLIHGRTAYGPAVFDLRQPAPVGGELSVQKALARAGIDTFAPNLLGYGRSTRFAHGLDDPGNASLRAYNTDGTCSYPEGCDRTHVPVFPLDQQGTDLLINPLGQQRRSHSSHVRFARVDTFVRDIRQVIDDAITRAQPSDGKVTLLGYSAGGQHVSRTLYAANPVLPHSDQYIAKVNRVVFLSSLFGFPTEETPPPTGFATFPLHVFKTDAASLTDIWQLGAGREPACTGHIVPGSPQQLSTQLREEETVGLQWGGDDPAHPTGLARSPVFSSYGWNTFVAGQLTPPTLVIHGVEDQVTLVANANSIYGALPASMTNKVLVKVACASHGLLWEGCSGQRCTPASGTPYGGKVGAPWAGPYSTLKAALIEWINSGTFNGAPNGQFNVNESGVVSAGP